MTCWKIFAAAAAALGMSTAIAAADPVAPQLNTPCTVEIDDAMTWVAGTKAPLICSGGDWQAVTDPYPTSDRWASYGPAMTLHGQGRPNPNLMSGAWTATPLTPETSCGATQLAVIPGSPTVGAPKVDQGVAGQPLSLQVVPVLFTIELTGDCLWQKSP
jgi:hypothetical protein